MCFSNLSNACLRLGHHPRQWQEATVAVVPKPNRTDPSLPKNYLLISFLECMGKLLEKIISNRLPFDINRYELVPTTQFGGRNAASTVDAGLTPADWFAPPSCLTSSVSLIT